ncbi:cell division ATP-binding protein FtsE [Candidatus Hepatobacter penaei]|uniref:cell division ATP-binding protein FtsE n=1 Tax=Candidatus Hepatobacter penaei TaxID=1274402 RepID=UPI0006979DF9|nr:ATP-binding cassette domain-containing protein [Candidatus Hepatobacter penaei]
MEPCVTFDRISIAHSEGFLLRNVSFQIEEKEFYFLTGASGSGKTSLLRVIYMDLMPFEGAVTLFDKKTRGLNAKAKMMIRRRLGIVFQENDFLPHLSILENVALPLHVRGFDARKALGHAEDLLAWMGVLVKPTQSVLTLSGGEKKRLAIARAVIGRPDVLIVDEPTGNLDEDTSLKILELLRRLNNDGMTVIMSTHNQSFVHYLNKPELRIENKGVMLNMPYTEPQDLTVNKAARHV